MTKATGNTQDLGGAGFQPALPDSHRLEAGATQKWRTLGLAALLVLAAGCQQKMAQQPYYRPLDPSGFFPDGRSNRTLEAGVVHRGQHLDADPLVTGLSQAEWLSFWKRDSVKVDATAAAKDEDREHAYGAPRYDPPRVFNPSTQAFEAFKPAAGTQAHAGQKIFNDEFPFEITPRDLSIGADRFTTYCAVCHGPLGNGKGKIWERGYLKPTSYHTEKVQETEPDETAQIPLGYSRGYWKWDIHIPVRDVPVGYIFEVITKGYGAMPDHAAQIKPDDRWRIIAYVRTLQFSRRAEVSHLPEGLKKGLQVGHATTEGHK